ncbi:hypothetical protein K435DRAFT_771919 [Dendrothele bispora CBS 962.96]|uniref:Uncharacterized protein n=1 Tax=Dendrothele bispora (strain CBS 962.96) TaxID=1314807 RepID=A0A4S8N053_DENBC|nr:hypothetical protein K435DRAFT_771919 [Dendrothele bispora CBS 962.96]
MSTTFPATDPQITYNPQENWKPFNSSKSTFHAGSSASLNFTGSLETADNPSATYIVDSEKPISQKIQRTDQLQKNIIFFSHTSPTPFNFHTLNTKSQREGGTLIVNSIVYPTPSPPGTNPTPSRGVSGGETTSTKKSGIIAGATTAIILTLLGMALLLCIQRRRRKTQKQLTKSTCNPSPDTMITPFQIGIPTLRPGPESTTTPPASNLALSLSRASATDGSLVIPETSSTGGRCDTGMSLPSSIQKVACRDLQDTPRAEKPDWGLGSLRTTWSEAPPSYRS